MNGSRAETSWLGGKGTYDFYDVKGVAEGLFRQLGIEISFENSSDEDLHPARQAVIMTKTDGKKVKLGIIGDCRLTMIPPSKRMSSCGTGKRVTSSKKTM